MSRDTWIIVKDTVLVAREENDSLTDEEVRAGHTELLSACLGKGVELTDGLPIHVPNSTTYYTNFGPSVTGYLKGDTNVAA